MNDISETNEFPFLINVNTNEKILISSHQFTIGKSYSCSYELNDNYISRTHLMIVKEDESWYIIDFNTKNGTYLNDIKIHSESQVKINNTDIIKVGNTSFIFYTNQ